jgi:hypothetical protein
MSYLDRIRACNRYDPKHFRAFLVDGAKVGSIKHRFAQQLARWPDVFDISPATVRLTPGLQSFEDRTEAVDKVVERLIRDGIIQRRHGERYPVTPSRRSEALFLLDRASAPYFGIRAFGQHLNGYVLDHGRVKMWIARRSRHKPNEPLKLDNMVAGGLPHDHSPDQNLANECWEEAAIPPQLVARARFVGLVSYRMETPQGLRSDTICCYDLELPPHFVPHCTDGEVQEFYLWPVERAAHLVRNTDEVKRNSNLVIIDFLLRHGHIPRDDPEYAQIVSRLRSASA